MRLAAAGGACDPFWQPGDDAEQGTLRRAAEQPRPEPGRLAAAQAQAGGTAQRCRRIRMRKTDRIERISENAANGFFRVDPHRPADRDPGECIADSIGASERHGQSRRAGMKLRGGSRPDHPFRI